MGEVTQQKFDRISILFFRTLCLYLILYFLFISDFSGNYPVLWHLNQVRAYLSDTLGQLLYKSFFNQNFKEVRFFDSYWTYSKLLTFLVIAFIAAFIWTMIDKGKGSRKLFVYMHTFSRYYLFAVMILYGLWKVFETQFVMGPHNFLQTIDHYTPETMYFFSVSVSRSYQIFGGILEVLVGFLFLSRKTTTLGAFLSLGILSNILFLNIGFDIPIKVIVIHLLLFNSIVIWPDILKLYRFFVLRGTETLSYFPSVFENIRFKGARYVVKGVLVGVVVIPQIKSNLQTAYLWNHRDYKDLIGIHKIDTSYRSQAGNSARIQNPKMWNQFTIEKDGFFFVLFNNDSITSYDMQADTLNKSIKIISWDNSFDGILHYQKMDSARWMFEGTCGKDSLRFVTRQFDVSHTHGLLKNYGRIIWSWNPSDPPDYRVH